MGYVLMQSWIIRGSTSSILNWTEHNFIYSHVTYNDSIARFLWPCRLTSRDKAKSLLLKGRPVDCYKPGLSSLSIIIHQATHGNLRCAMLWENQHTIIGQPAGSKKFNKYEALKINITYITLKHSWPPAWISKYIISKILRKNKEYQRTNDPENAHLISWPGKAQNIQKQENKMVKKWPWPSILTSLHKHN